MGKTALQELDVKVDKITEIIGCSFPSFGGGENSQECFGNPVAVALKDKPYQFAAGVDIKTVVIAVLGEAKKLKI